MSHVGQSLTKDVFARVFKEAWLDTVKARSIVNAFAGSGIFPVDASKTSSKTTHSNVFCDPSTKECCSNSSPQDSLSQASKGALRALEQQMEEETILMFEERLAEGYDLVEDPLYNAWSKLRKANMSESNTSTATSTSTGKQNLEPSTVNDSDPIPEFSMLSIGPAFREELVVPKPVERKKPRVTAKMPSHVSGQEMIRILEEKKKQKEEEEAAKIQRKAEREAKRLQ